MTPALNRRFHRLCVLDASGNITVPQLAELERLQKRRRAAWTTPKDRQWRAQRDKLFDLLIEATERMMRRPTSNAARQRCQKALKRYQEFLAKGIVD